jgi:malonyl-CoA O-methyltransferase
MTLDFTSSTLEAYERWAPLYPPTAHNPLMRVEQQTMVTYWPKVAGLRALDLASGSGRYSRLLADTHAAEIVAVDFCVPMLTQVTTGHRICASMLQLPFAPEMFDVAICGLALGHAPDLQTWMHEVARTLKSGGTLLYSDFHPQAAQMNLTRSFRDETNQLRMVPHYRHDLESQRHAAQRAGLTIDVMFEVRVGREFHEQFANSDQFYQRWDGLPIVLVVRAHK